MKNTQNKEKHPQNLKKKLMSALAMLLIATVLMSTTTYAWFVLSTAPEVTGIETQVGANGSLEIALLNKNTRENMSLIASGIAGGSLQEERVTANNAWGNLVDLSYAQYGLSDLLLLPARLDTSDGLSVDLNKLLVVPNYGYDGRILDVSGESVSGTYDGTDFVFSSEQDFGVRAVGTSNALTPQQAGLGSAKTNISTYMRGANTTADNTLTTNGSGLFDIIITYATEVRGVTGANADPVFVTENRDVLLTILEDLDDSLEYIELSLRYGLVAFAASELADEAEFAVARDFILDTKNTLDELMTEVGGSAPLYFVEALNKLTAMQNDLDVAKAQCERLTGDSYSWDQIKPILTKIMNVDKILIADKGIGELNEDMLMGLIGGTIEVTLAPESGLFADIADFAGNFTSNITFAMLGNTVIEMMTVSVKNPVYLQELLNHVNVLNAAGGGVGAAALPMDATYGYAIDLAFRCNAAMPDLVLQTEGVQRVYNGGEDPADLVSNVSSTQGGGSYMEFTTTDATLTVDQMLALMDALRVGFVDDQGNIMAIAKLNIQSRAFDGDAIKAPLYLYDYAFETNETGMVLTMGERQKTNNTITELQQNVAKAVTVVVWLDGDLVDNTMVSADRASSMGGRLNLQFATNAELIPAADGSTLNYTADKAGLETALEAAANAYDAGQLNNTNVSWNAFKAAYERAVDVNENENAGQVEISSAVKNLAEAFKNLEEVSVDALNAKIADIRALMGSTSDIGRFVIKNEDGSYSAVGDEDHTQEVHDSWTIVGELYSVDYNKNTVDEGNGVYTTIYTDDSWYALADALYDAEATAMNPVATDDAINGTLTALDDAEKALTRRVYFTPYDYNGDIFYMARWLVDAEDTYGRWYDSNFKRILSEATMLKLDAYAEETVIGQLGVNGSGEDMAWVSSGNTYITPDIAFLESVYPELRDVEVKGVHWDVIDTEFFTEMADATHYDKLKKVIDIYNSTELNSVRPAEADDPANVTYLAAKKLLDNYEDFYTNTDDITASEVNTAIAELHAVNTALYEELETKNAADNTLPMTENQKTMLNAAINAAKAYENYETTMSGLKEATEAAELAVSNADTNREQATTALANLNTELVEVGVTEVTEYNTLTHKLPEGMGSSDIVYNVDFPGLKLKLTGKSGTTKLGATILTEDGVVLKVSKDITIYDAPDKIMIHADGVNAGSSVTMTKGGDSVLLSAGLYYEEGGVNTGDKPLNELVRETIVSVDYVSERPQYVNITELESGECQLFALEEGSTTIYITVKTDAGNTYTTEQLVTVTAPVTP